MAADTAFVRTFAQYNYQGSTSTPPMVNYAPPDWALPAPAQGQGTRLILVPLAGVSVGLDGWVSIQAILINNRDPTNYIEVAYTYSSPTGGAIPNVVPVLPGAGIVICGPVSIGQNLLMTAFGNTVKAEYAIFGT